jgi:hypothetical protein
MEYCMDTVVVYIIRLVEAQQSGAEHSPEVANTRDTSGYNPMLKESTLTFQRELRKGVT